MENVRPYLLPFCGNINFWKQILKQEEVVFSFSRKLDKKSYTNRTLIATANGIQTLSIPLEGGRGSRIPYCDILMSNQENWRAKHLMALQSAYSKSPFYEFYIDKIAKVYASNHPLLQEFNLELFNTISKILKVEIVIKTEESTSIPISFEPNIYEPMPSYPQVFRNKYAFQPDLSILDLIFNLGNKSLNYLRED
jgi:hypothetical protein